ncbi:MAG: hypothetical protein H0U54_02995 [Acidobacteria bacterium]|nr:hypothetical protein [Acidobacteriota bacterium]
MNNNSPRAGLHNNSSINSSELPLIEGEDYYLENGLFVLTARFLLRRGYCCGNDCRHCPYPKESHE